MDDVLIIGGGHSGLYLAGRLASAGLKVSLYDQKSAIGDKVVCTGIIGAEAFERFDLPRHTIVGSVEKVRFYSPSGSHFDYAPEKALAHTVDRKAFNRHFAERAASAGASIFTGCRVEGLKVKPDSVSAKINQQGTAGTVSARIVVLATGVNYKLFEWLGLKPPASFLGGAQVHVPETVESWTSVYVGSAVAPGAFGWKVPVSNGTARVGVLAEKNPILYLKQLLSGIMPGWRDDIPESSFEIRPIVQGPIESSAGERVLVVGEAAGQIKTTTGGGIYYAFLGAEMAYETITRAFVKKRFDAKFLGAYDKRWKKHIGEELKFGHYCRKLFAKLPDEQLEELFADMNRQQILSVAHREAHFDWHKGVIVSILKLPLLKKIIQNPF